VATRAELDRRYRERQVALAGRVADRLGGMLGRMNTLGELELHAYVAGAYPTVAGGQQVAATGAAGYMAALVPRREAARAAPVDVAGALARSGVLVTPESRSLVAPVLRARSLVADGAELAVAIDAATSYAGALSSLDLQAAQRVGLEESARASEAEVEGWTKDAGPSACTWCHEIAENEYADPDAVPYHENDRCSVVPVLEGRRDYGPNVITDDIPF
jgi:hypothetical protein